MFLAFVAAMRNIGLEDVTVAGFQFLQDGGFVDDAGTAVVGECAEKNGAFAILGIHGAELGEIFAEQRVCLFLGELDASAIWLARLDLMTVADIGPVLRFVDCLEFLDYQNCPLKKRQFHDTSFGCESRRSDRDGHYRHEENQDFLHRIIGVTDPTIGPTIPGVSPPSSPPLLPLNSKVCSHGVEPKLSSITMRNLCASDERAV